jgi:hypothetical protein
MTQALFIALNVSTLVYFAFVRRRYDLYTLAAGSATIYFIPGFLGVDLRQIALVPDVYIVMMGVLLMLILYTAFVDRIRSSPKPRVAFSGTDVLLHVYAVLAIGATIFVLVRFGPARLFGDRGGVPLPAWVYVMWRITVSLFVLLAFVKRSRWLWIGIPFATCLYLAADRTGPAMITLAVIVAWLSSVSRSHAWKMALRVAPFLVVFTILMMFGDHIFTFIRLAVTGGNVAQAAEVVTRNVDPRITFLSSEPFLTQMILNEIFRADFYVGPHHLLGIFYQIWPEPSAFGYPSGIFNELFQTTLFPESRSETANWGMAYSFWGEAIAAGGWGMYVLFLAIYVGGLSLFNRMTTSPSAAIKSCGALMGAYWAFYIHRNSIGNILTYERHILYVAFFCAMVALLVPIRRRRNEFVADPASSYRMS